MLLMRGRDALKLLDSLPTLVASSTPLDLYGMVGKTVVSEDHHHGTNVSFKICVWCVGDAMQVLGPYDGADHGGHTFAQAIIKMRCAHQVTDRSNRS